MMDYRRMNMICVTAVVIYTAQHTNTNTLNTLHVRTVYIYDDYIIGYAAYSIHLHNDGIW